MENNPITVLYVDDEQQLLDIGKIFLERYGSFRVEIAPSAREGLDILTRNHFDAIISDYQMPGMDGIMLLQEVRKRFGEIPFILFTGRGREEVVIQAINEGADFYLQKGGEPKSQFTELTHKVRQAVGRKKAEKTVRESEKRLSDIFDFLPDPTFAIDSAGRVIAWNKAITDLTRIPAELMIGKGKEEYETAFYTTEHPVLIDLIDEPDETILLYYTNLDRVGETITAESVMLSPQGARIHILAKVSRLYDQEGNRSGAIESLRDITALKRSEEELRESEHKLKQSEQRYRMVVNDQTEMIARFTPDGTITFINEAYHQYFAPILHIEDIKGKNIRELMFIRNFQEVEEFLHSLSTESPSREMERMATLSDDRIRWQLWNVRALFDESGTPSEYQVVGRDITEKKESDEKIRQAYEKIAADEEELREKYEELAKSEQIIRESEERLVLAQEVANTGSWHYNPLSDTIWGSAEGSAIFGFPRSSHEFSIDDIESCIQDRERVHQALTDLVQYGKEYDLEYVINPVDGSPPRYIHSRARAEYDDQGTLIRITGVIQDITEWKKAQEEIAFKNMILSTQQEVAPEGILVVDSTGNIMSYNQNFLIIWDIPEEVIAPRLDDLVLAYIAEKLSDKAAFMSRVQYLYEHPEEKSFEEISLKDERILERFSAPMISETGEYFGRVWYFRDISARKKTEYEIQAAYEEIAASESTLQSNFLELQKSEQELREAQHRLSDIINFAPDPTFAIDAEGKVVAWNHAIEVYTGVSASDMIGKGGYEYAIPFYGERRTVLLNLIHAPDEELAERYSHILHEGETVTAEAKIRLLTGEERIVWAKACPLYDAGHIYIGAIESMRDITEWMKASSALKKNEAEIIKERENFKTIFNNSHDAIFIHDKTGKIVDVNATMCRMYRIEHEEAIHYSLPDYLGPESTIDDGGMIWQEVLDGQDKIFTCQARRPRDETFFYAEVFLTRIDLADEPFILANVRDITAVREAETMLAESEEKARKAYDQISGIAETIPGVVFQFYARQTGEMGLYYVSRRAAEIFEIEGDISTFFQQFSMRVHEDDRVSFLNSIEAAIKNECRWNYEGRYIKPSGGGVDFRGISAPVRVGNELVFSGVMLDITSQKKAEEGLIKEKEFSSLLFEASPAFIVAISNEGKTLSMNRILLEALEYSAEEIKGKDYLTTFVPEGDRTMLARVFSRIISTSSVTRNENRIMSKSGKIFLVEWHGQPLQGPDGKVDFFIGVGIDITNRNREGGRICEISEVT